MAFLLLLGFLTGPGAPRAGASDLAFERYTLRTQDGEEHPAELARLGVPERRDRASSKTIRIAALKLKSRSSAPGPPIFFLSGGPGIPAIGMGRSPAYWKLFDRLRDVGDVYLIDQRGSGFSDPSLLCSPRALNQDVFLSDSSAAAAVRGLVGSCASGWRERGVDLDAYNTVESAHDLEALRVALGVERVRLLGVSYGCELGLAMMRLHGDRVDRAVLAGVRGPRTALKRPETLDLQLRRLAALVARDSTYAPLLPDPYGLVQAILDVLEQKPLTITVTPHDGSPKRDYRVGPAGLRIVLQSDLADARAITGVPAMLRTMKDGDPRIFLTRLRTMYDAMSRGTVLMALTMNCATRWQPERLDLVMDEARDSPFGNIRNLYLNPPCCDAVGVADLGPSYRMPVTSDLPVLFVSGSMDVTTPSFEAEEIAWGFPNGTHWMVQNGFHETLAIDEVQRSVVEYFGGTSLRGRTIVVSPPAFVSVEEATKRLREELPTPRGAR